MSAFAMQRPKARVALVRLRCGVLRTQELDDFVLVGELARCVLREHELIVGGYVEDAATALDELGLDAQLLAELRFQTGSAREVASATAVGDRNFHLLHYGKAKTQTTPP